MARESRVDVVPQVAGKNHESLVGFDAPQEIVDFDVGIAIVRVPDL
jgi:hypothetical protein